MPFPRPGHFRFCFQYLFLRRTLSSDPNLSRFSDVLDAAQRLFFFLLLRRGKVGRPAPPMPRDPTKGRRESPYHFPYVEPANERFLSVLIPPRPPDRCCNLRPFSSHPIQFPGLSWRDLLSFSPHPIFFLSFFLCPLIPFSVR